MSELTIGVWVRRESRGVSDDPKWHLVESVIEDRAVVRCGKQLRRVARSGRELQVSDVMPLTRMIGQPQLCRGGCQRADDTTDTDAVPEG